LLADASRLLVLVWDGVLSPPVLAPGLPEDEEENGRGLLIVGALATCWHWYNPPGPYGGKVVWALLEGATDADSVPPAPSATAITVPPQDCRRLESHMRPVDGSPEGTPVQTCSCGYVAATADEAYVHLSEAFIPADDRDPAGVVHAEAARESSEPPLAFRCTCGHDAGGPLHLDIHIRQALAPESGLGLDGQRHDLAFFRLGAADA
ncbi:MAG TPA: ATP-binding protein, partial [Trebonia sp.]|nr:ATP-binding protein [Trebonia sp.]